MKNLFKHLAAWTILFGIIWLGSGCSSITPETTALPVVISSTIKQKTKADLIALTIVNKEKSRLKTILAEILDGGTIISKKVTAKRYADGTEISTEKWIVEDNHTPKNRFLATWENGVLISIDTLVKEKKEKPLGG